MARWLAKAVIQKILSKTPGGYQINYALQSARGKHSQELVERRIPELLRFLSKINSLQPIFNCQVLELGTGWNAINAVLLSLLGASEVVATDYTRHLRLSHMTKVLLGARKQVDRIAEIRKVDSSTIIEEIDNLLELKTEKSMLEQARINYMAPVEACKLGFPNDRFDLIYSWGVLAHFPEHELPQLAVESQRLLKPNGLAAHFFGLHDPYATQRTEDKVNFLRFSDRTWKLLNSDLQPNNRLRASQHTGFYTDLGAEVLFADRQFRPEVVEKLKAVSVDRKFSGLEMADLATHYYQMICRFGKQHPD